jgi:excisionase family DNA binding protein
MEEHENDPRLLITVEEGARRLSIGRSHLYKHLQSGALRSLLIGRSRRVAVADLDRFVTRRLHEGEQ